MSHEGKELNIEADDRDLNEGIGAAESEKEKKKSDEEASEFSGGDSSGSNEGIGAAETEKEKKKSDEEASEFGESKSSGKQIMIEESEERMDRDIDPVFFHRKPLEETEPWINKMKDIIDRHFEESCQLKQSDDKESKSSGKQIMIEQSEDRTGLVFSPSQDVVVDIIQQLSQDVVVDIIQQLFAHLLRRVSHTSVPTNDPQFLVRLLTGADSIPQARGEPTISDSAQKPLAGENTTPPPHGPNPPSGFMDDATVFSTNMGFLWASAGLFVIFTSIGVHKSDPNFRYQVFRLLTSTIGYFLSLGGIFSHGRIRLAKNLMKATVVACWSAVSSCALSGVATFFPDDCRTHIAVIIVQTILIVIVASLAAYVRI